jgi:hypothetical protein
MAVAPFTQFTQFLYFGVAVLHVVLLRQASRVEYSDIATETEENARRFVG